MVKRFIILMLLLLVFVSSAFCATDPIDKYITAYKRKVENSIPTGELQFRVVDPKGESFDIAESSQSSGTVDVPYSARNNEIQAFSWVLSGNVFGAVTMDLEFGPMAAAGNASKVIPYTVTETFTSTRVGNTTVGINKTPSSVGKIAIDFIKDVKYELQYADSVNVTDPSTSGQTVALSRSVSVNTTSKKLRVSADMSTKTIITPSEPEYSSKFKNDDGSSMIVVCEHWNRYGSVTVNLGMTADGKINGVPALADTYYANVVVTLSCAN